MVSGRPPPHPPSRRAPGADDPDEICRRALVTLAAAFCQALSTCASAAPPETNAPPPATGQAGTPAAVLDQARDVAAQLEQREADLESMIP
jgi:hypothetical protein